MSEPKQKAFCADYAALLEAWRAVLAEVNRLSGTSGGTSGLPPGIIESDFCVEDTGEGFQLVPVDSALGAILENEPFSPGFYRRFGRVHYLITEQLGSEEYAGPCKRIAAPDWGPLSDSFLFQAWEAAAGGGSIDLADLEAAVQSLAAELAKLRRWKESAGRKPLR